MRLDEPSEPAPAVSRHLIRLLQDVAARDVTRFTDRRADAQPEEQRLDVGRKPRGDRLVGSARSAHVAVAVPQRRKELRECFVGELEYLFRNPLLRAQRTLAVAAVCTYVALRPA